MRRAANRIGSIQSRPRIGCAGGSRASAEPVAAVSCWAAGPCRLRAAWHWLSRRRGSAQLLGACAARGTGIEAASSWREYLLLARFLPAGNIVHRVAVASFPRRRDRESLRPIHMRKMARSKTRITSRFLFGKGFHDFFRSDGNFINPNSDGVVDGIGDRGHDRKERALTDFFSAKRAAGVRSFDELGDHFWHIERSRAFIFEDRGELVHQRMRKFLRKAPELLFFHECFTETHVDAAFDLAAHQRRIQRTADVMRNPDLGNRDPACHWIYFDLDDRSGIRVGGGRPYAAAFVQRGRLWRGVGANRSNRAETSFGQANSFYERDALFWCGGIEYTFVSKAQPFFRYFEFFRYGFSEDCFSAFRGFESRVSRH